MVIGPVITSKALLSVLKDMTKTNWTINNTRPDSTIIEMRGVKSCIPLACVSRRAKEALAILNTSRPVRMAFKARDTEREIKPMGVPTGVNQPPGRFSTYCCPRIAISPTTVNPEASAFELALTSLQFAATLAQLTQGY
jgi:hypothetical protein